MRFSRRNGTFRSVRPDRDWGALELAVRYSTLDLDDGDITGGEQSNAAIGLNWYANTNFRVMANFIRYDADPNRNGIDEDGNIIQIRIQATL